MSVIRSDLARSLSWLWWAALDLTALCPLTLTFIALSDLSRFLVYGHKPVGFGQCLQSALMNEAVLISVSWGRVTCFLHFAQSK